MVYIAAQFIFSFIASAGFGFIFNVPGRSLIQCGVVGMLGWILFRILTDNGVDAIQASFAGAIVVALTGHFLAKYHKTPIIIFIIPGIIPLVPGGAAYDAMRHVVTNDYSGAIPLAFKAFTISGAIAIGLVFTEVLVQLLLRGFHYMKRS
ncbi:MAG TPA: threonine/serine exporter family protein [Bacillaceae bacterium]